MSKQAAIQFQAYKLLLESNKLTSRQKQLLIEFGFFDKIKSLFGTAKNVGGTVVSAMKDKVYQDQLVASQKKIEKELVDLKAIGAKVGKGDDFINEFLKALLDAQGIDPSAIAAVQPASDAATSGTETGGPKPGTAVDPAKPEDAVPAIAAAAAQAAGADPEKAKEQAEEKKVDLPKATKVLAVAISKTSGVEGGKVAKIIDFLIQNKHMLAEGNRRLAAKDIWEAAREASLISRDFLVLERWNLIAGTKLLKEEAPKPDEAKKKKFEDVIDDIRAKFKPEELSDDDILNTVIALDELEAIEIK